nr:hypothetical protein B14D6.500 [imported] - Neurospora crassa [Neurospora crassa]
MNRKRTKDTGKPLDNSDVLVAQHRQSSRYLHKIVWKSSVSAQTCPDSFCLLSLHLGFPLALEWPTLSNPSRNPRVNSVDGEFHVGSAVSCSARASISTCPWQSNTLGHQGCWSIAKPFKAKKDSVTWVP